MSSGEDGGGVGGAWSLPADAPVSSATIIPVAIRFILTADALPSRSPALAMRSKLSKIARRVNDRGCEVAHIREATPGRRGPILPPDARPSPGWHLSCS